ncbi:MAG: DUF1905 domain-containing protein [Alphaproteobacteria bacterium]|nr:DUF1905 domain-containing protein [Alphaproteobacteria bacterium]
MANRFAHGLEFKFKGEIWMYHGKGAWFFITLPKDISAEIKIFSGGKRRGWGSVRVTAKIKNTAWQTSIFPDSKAGTYLLPIKASVRKAENIKASSKANIFLCSSASEKHLSVIGFARSNRESPYRYR